MDWQLEASMGGRAIVATLLGGVIGWERERSGHEAGVRTCGMVALGACIFGLVSAHVGAGDPTRIAAQVVSGIGFLGAGIMIRERGQVKGLTTAATILAVAAIGLAVSFQMFVIALISTAMMVTLLAARLLPGWGAFTRDTEPCPRSQPSPRELEGRS